MMKLPNNYTLYDTTSDNDIPYEQLYLTNFETIASQYETFNFYDPIILNNFKSWGFVEYVKHFSSNRRKETYTKIAFINKDKRMIISATLSPRKSVMSLTFKIYYDLEFGAIEDQFEFKNLTELLIIEKKTNISLIKREYGSLDIEEFHLDVKELDLSLNYGNSFLTVHNNIINRLNKPKDNGIILLHGVPGSGKSHYIKYLTTQIKDKEVLFISPSMAEILAEPEIIPFLLEHKDSVLIIEEAERVIANREEGHVSPAVSNILNLTDGILGDCLNVQIIATFNTSRENIDAALLRPGRLIAEHRFNKLSIDEANNLLKSLNYPPTDEEMTLADIYNLNVEINKPYKKENKIGFF